MRSRRVRRSGDTMHGYTCLTAWTGLSLLLVCGCHSAQPPATAPAADVGKVTIYLNGMGEKLHLL